MSNIKTCHIINPDRGIWNVYDAEDYDWTIKTHTYMAEDEGGNLWFSQGAIFDAIRSSCQKELARELLASFKTRKEARAYVESIGAIWA